jgi:hypothetical protein
VFQREAATARLLFRRKNVVGGLLLGVSLSYAAVLLLVSEGAQPGPRDANDSLALHSEKARNVRTRQTPADLYFEKHGTIPRPSVMHAVLDAKTELSSDKQKCVLVIGDVHGCFQELQMIFEAAQKDNDDFPFRFVILVGDLTMKGPNSTSVLRFIREQPNWLAVRGNNDDAALKAILGDSARRKKKGYKWIMDGETSAEGLSDEDVMWLTELPYTITIPKSFLHVDSEGRPETELVDTTIVHAGFIPGVELQDQTIATMVTVREIDPIYQDTSSGIRTDVTFAHHLTQNGRGKDAHLVRGKPVPWASVWKGPNRVIFGHDAKRGLQLYEGEWATGIDTGACYGKQLTGIILPRQRFVQIDALKAYAPIGNHK